MGQDRLSDLALLIAERSYWTEWFWLHNYN